MEVLGWLVNALIMLGIFACWQRLEVRKKLPYRFNCSEEFCLFEISATNPNIIADMAETHKQSHEDEVNDY